jgi:hypothetical protein
MLVDIDGFGADESAKLQLSNVAFKIRAAKGSHIAEGAGYPR